MRRGEKVKRIPVFGYVRVAPLGQGGATVQEQERAIRGIAMARGTPVTKMFVDRDVHGYVPFDARPAAQELLDEIAPGTVIVVAKLQYVFRSAAEALALLGEWQRKQVALVVAEFGAEPVNYDGAAKMFFSLLAITAEFEREKVLDQPVKSRRVSSLTGGKPGSIAPFGFRISGEGERAMLVEDPEQQAAIKTMIRLRPEMSLRAIAEEVFKRHAIRISHEGVRQVLADYETRTAGGRT